ncbi:SLATT domain-containing protein [Nonomuraea soli]|uniref:SMODS and SLOG-associating 2TM effector domain-containing protein n=1 Tax=Nonomuraea soli TaxID=1032476 RepID=A0A7W0CRF2_9ACTN|nr:SLATT domain-containing protein [Nonomuraea soli]MBA2895969.1 hypothetical protein [Nonomuraea soli]
MLRKTPDLRPKPFPLISQEEWKKPQEVLNRLYTDAEAWAMEVCGWYLEDRVRQRRTSKALRGLAIVLAAAGGLQPLAAAASGSGSLGWGYVLLAGAGVCVAFDHLLGLSSRWMRDMVTAQRIQRRLRDFQLDWTALNAQQMTPPVREYLAALRTFVTDISTIMSDETSEWVSEFQSGLAQLPSAHQPGER